MSKAELFREVMPTLKELAAECVVMDVQDYEEFKNDVMEECDARAKGFLRAVLSTIDSVREKRGGQCGLEPKIQVLVKTPVVNPGPAFYDTLEGCMFANRDKELHDAVREAFKGLSHEDKRLLCFSPEPGRYLLRVQLWASALAPALPPRLYHKAMGAILHKYVSIKLSYKREDVRCY